MTCLFATTNRPQIANFMIPPHQDSTKAHGNANSPGKLTANQKMCFFSKTEPGIVWGKQL